MLGKMLHLLQSRVFSNASRRPEPCVATLPNKYAHTSYSQCGEDLIIAFIAKQCGIDISFYFDIGANHPYHYSNTYLFYSLGASGVCVEPIPSMAQELNNARPRDKTISSIISSCSTQQSFFILEPSTLSTTDPSSLKRALETPGAVFVEEILFTPVSLTSLFEEHGIPQLLCIDVEGSDMEVLSSWDIARYRPPLLCVEDLEYSTKRGERRPAGVTDYLLQNGYMLFANTFINSILVDSSIWMEP